MKKIRWTKLKNKVFVSKENGFVSAVAIGIAGMTFFIKAPWSTTFSEFCHFPSTSEVDVASFGERNIRLFKNVHMDKLVTS